MKDRASTLSFFGFLNLCSRNLDLGRKHSAKQVCDAGSAKQVCGTGFQNGLLRSKLRTKKHKICVSPLLIYSRIRKVRIPSSGIYLDFSNLSLKTGSRNERRNSRCVNDTYRRTVLETTHNITGGGALFETPRKPIIPKVGVSVEGDTTLSDPGDLGKAVQDWYGSKRSTVFFASVRLSLVKAT